MSPAAAAAAIWSPRVLKAQRARRRSKTEQRSPLVEVPSHFVKPIEEVMAALTVIGQKEFKAELAKAARSSNPGSELGFVVSSWHRTMFLVGEPSFWEALERLPQLRTESELLTPKALAARIGL
ncbi:MAG: hypothetical protein ACYDAL_14195 [Candidatus Dormibacteraceae bacterium]